MSCSSCNSIHGCALCNHGYQNPYKSGGSGGPASWSPPPTYIPPVSQNRGQSSSPSRGGNHQSNSKGSGSGAAGAFVVLFGIAAAMVAISRPPNGTPSTTSTGTDTSTTQTSPLAQYNFPTGAKTYSTPEEAWAAVEAAAFEISSEALSRQKPILRSYFMAGTNELAFILDSTYNIRVQQIEYDEGSNTFNFKMDDGVTVPIPGQNITPEQIAQAKNAYVAELLPDKFEIDGHTKKYPTGFVLTPKPAAQPTVAQRDSAPVVEIGKPPYAPRQMPPAYTPPVAAPAPRTRVAALHPSSSLFRPNPLRHLGDDTPPEPTYGTAEEAANFTFKAIGRDLHLYVKSGLQGISHLEYGSDKKLNVVMSDNRIIELPIDDETAASLNFYSQAERPVTGSARDIVGGQIFQIPMYTQAYHALEQVAAPQSKFGPNVTLKQRIILEGERNRVWSCAAFVIAKRENNPCFDNDNIVAPK